MINKGVKQTIKKTVNFKETSLVIYKHGLFEYLFSIWMNLYQ